jgi:hypothetical protein
MVSVSSRVFTCVRVVVSLIASSKILNIKSVGYLVTPRPNLVKHSWPEVLKLFKGIYWTWNP